ncbi:MAG: helix-turn-helix domain-containing protein [Faecousia sp.]
MNNLKQIRELYGATQEQVATAINVNRVTVGNWESGNSIASSSNQEKLSIYYGVGPEYFYRKALDETARQLIANTAQRARKVAEESEGKRNKETDFHKMFESITFKEAMDRYMFSMKVLLATADSGELDKLRTALQINKKMGNRLNAIIKLREEEEASEEPTLFDLIEKTWAEEE